MKSNLSYLDYFSLISNLNNTNLVLYSDWTIGYTMVHQSEIPNALPAFSENKVLFVQNNNTADSYFYRPALYQYTMPASWFILHTISTQIEPRHSNSCPEFFGAVAFWFEPNMTIVIKYLSQKVDFWSKNWQVLL